MSHSTTPIRESTLAVNLSEEAHAFVRELAMACRKMSIYGHGHPLAAKAVEKPFFILGTIFRFKNVVNLNVTQGRLYLLNILLKDSVFNNQILQYLQVVDANAVLFERRMTIKEFAFFIDSLLRRDMVYDPSFNLGGHLKEKGIDSIQVNTELAFALLENRKQYRGDVDGDFSARRLAMDQLGTDLMVLARIQQADSPMLLQYGIDFDPEIVTYLLPEKIAAFSSSEVRTVLNELVETMNSDKAEPEQKTEASSHYMSLFKLVEYHPERERIIENLNGWHDRDAAITQTDSDPSSATGAIKIETSRRIDNLIEELFAAGDGNYDATEFCDSFTRLLKTGQRPKAEKVIARLTDLMSAADPGFRQKALNLLGAVIGKLNFTTDSDVVTSAVNGVVSQLADKRETYEYSELIWRLFEVCRREKQYRLMALLTTAMAGRRTVMDDVTVYDSMAVKKAFENISRPEIIDQLIDQLVKAGHQQTEYIRDIMVAIGSEEMALGLSRIISHPLRPVRQLTLKILAALGKSSLKVFSDILLDDTMFARESSRHELPNAKWYVIRNSIFVLGSLRDEQGVPALRARISDKDIRIRREIISALEKIGGEEAVDCLTVMAEDPFTEIREAAIIAVGLVGQPESVPLLIDIARRNPSESVRCVISLGKLGGPEARAFLGRLLDDPEELARLAGGGVSRDDLRVGVIKALSNIGDQSAIEQIKKFQESQSVASKIFFKNSPVNKAITQALSRR